MQNKHWARQLSPDGHANHDRWPTCLMVDNRHFMLNAPLSLYSNSKALIWKEAERGPSIEIFSISFLRLNDPSLCVDLGYKCGTNCFLYNTCFALGCLSCSCVDRHWSGNTFYKVYIWRPNCIFLADALSSCIVQVLPLQLSITQSFRQNLNFKHLVKDLKLTLAEPLKWKNIKHKITCT